MVRIVSKSTYKSILNATNIYLKKIIIHLLVSSSDLEDLEQALKWAQHCLNDAQSQQDVDLIMQLLAKEEFRNAYAIFTTLSQPMSRVSPTSPLTAQALDLCQEVTLNHQTRFWICLKLFRDAHETNGRLSITCLLVFTKGLFILQLLSNKLKSGSVFLKKNV